MIKLYLAVSIALGLSACVTEDDMPLPPGDPVEEELDENGQPIDPPDQVIPGDGNDTCGGAQLKADGPCTP
ncbi:MAG: hypothetical protein JWP01_184 [Myxococcales bacterium]|nr:hypothetical protein [Myxococcales bacterium]